MESEFDQNRSRPTSGQIESVIKQRRRTFEARSAIFKTVRIVTFVAAAAVLISVLFFPTVSVQRGSMIPTLLDGDQVVVTTIGGIGRGDIIAFNLGNRAMIKRIIAEPGQWVDIDANGVVYVDREPINEQYLAELSLGVCDIRLPMQVPDNQYFVMGDNRAISIDSRTSEFGTVHREEVIGKAVLRIWPLNRIGFVS